MRNVLLMTATITPMPGIPVLARTNPAERLEDYCTALRFYQQLLGSCFDGIVFAENSGSDLSKLRAEAAKGPSRHRVEFLSFNGLDFPPEYGRGYGEFKLVEYAMSNSALLRDKDVVTWKVTGRYICENIAKIVRSFPEGVDLYCHMRDYPYRLCELFMLAWTQWGYVELIHGVAERLRNNQIPGTHTIEEKLFRNWVEDAALAGNAVAPRFRHVPVIKGVRGWNNTQFSETNSAKLWLRRGANVFLPWVWI